VQAFSGDGTIGLTGSRLQISHGGMGPLWGPRGSEVYYQKVVGVTTTPKLMAVPITYSPRLEAQAPRELLTAEMHDGLHTKAVTADGNKFLVVLKSREKPPVVRLIAVTDWQGRLR